MAGPALLQRVLKLHGLSALDCATIPGCVRTDLRTMLVVATAIALPCPAIPRKSQARPAISLIEGGGGTEVGVTRRFRDGRDGTSRDPGAPAASLSVPARRSGAGTRAGSAYRRHQECDGQRTVFPGALS